MRIHLPVQQMFGWSDIKRVVEDGDSTMGCGAQLNHLRSEEYLLLVPIVGAMIECNLNSHPPSSGPRLDPGRRHLTPQAPYPPDVAWKLGCKKTLAYCRRDRNR